MAKHVHPNDVFEALLQGCTRTQKATNLKLLHDLCSAQHGGSRDFTLATIGKLWEAVGGIKARALYNAPSEDYRTLIKTWEDYSGPADVKAPEVRDSKRHGFLARIDDPAVRALVQAALIERDKLQAEVNLLKSVTVLKLDRSPALANAPGTSTAHALALPAPKKASPDLTPSEREALERAISAVFLSDQGWTEGRNGEVLNEKGRRLFEPGFTKAVKKVLAK